MRCNCRVCCKEVCRSKWRDASWPWTSPAEERPPATLVQNYEIEAETSPRDKGSGPLSRRRLSGKTTREINFVA